MKVLVTGSDGFIGKNLIFRLQELGIRVFTFTRKSKSHELSQIIPKIDFVVHLAGENRPKKTIDYEIINFELTSLICDHIKSSKKYIPIIFSSSTQAQLPTAYGKSKLKAESVLKKLHYNSKKLAYIYRLPGVFGKWCKPNYNSVVSTFCFNIINELPIKINDPSYELKLVYIDDVVDEFVNVILGKNKKLKNFKVKPEYKISLFKLSNIIKSFKDSRKSLVIDKVGNSLIGNLYSTYLSYLKPDEFTYPIPKHVDNRGIFAEVLKTKNSGQFSFFSAKPGITRGGHYHHSKTEKFIILQGKAKFCFKDILTLKTHEIIVTSDTLRVVETVPGWAHNITNIGSNDLIVMLWANEIFNTKIPDTYNYKL